MLLPALDTLLDRSIVGGYSSIGYRLRRRQWGASELERLDGKVAVITGASSGIGLAAASGIAALGASVWLLVRDLGRGERARAQIVKQSGSGDVHVAGCDLSSVASVRAAARQLGSVTPHIDVLVNNAGVLTSGRQISVDGIELTLATNVIGPFLLTGLLMAQLREQPGARVINVSSGGMYSRRITVDDLQSASEPFDGARVYAHSKRAEVILTELWAEHLPGSGVSFHAMHPGWVDTAGIKAALPGFHRLMRPLLRTPEQGADTIVWLAGAAEAERCSGSFWHDRRRRPTHLLPVTRETPEERELLWNRCLELSGLDLEPAATGAATTSPGGSDGSLPSNT